MAASSRYRAPDCIEAPLDSVTALAQSELAIGA
jgi:hypothetical protein